MIFVTQWFNTNVVIQVGRYPRHLISLFFRLLYPWYWPSSCWNFAMSCIKAIFQAVLALLFSILEKVRGHRNSQDMKEEPVTEIELLGNIAIILVRVVQFYSVVVNVLFLGVWFFHWTFAYVVVDIYVVQLKVICNDVGISILVCFEIWNGI